MYRVFLLAMLAAFFILPATLLAEEARPVKELSEEQIRLNQQGVEALVKENPASAVALLTEAYRLGPINVLALNLGRAHHALGQCERGREMLEKVSTLPVIEHPPAERIDQLAQDYLADLEASCQPEQPEEEHADSERLPTDRSIEPPPETEPFAPGVGHYASGAGAVLLASGLGLHLGARAQRSRAESRIFALDSFEGDVNRNITQREIAQIEARANLLDTIGLGTAIVGTAALATGLYLLFYPEPTGFAFSLGLSLHPEHAGVLLDGRF